MRQILETEEHVQIPAGLYSDPFYRITYFIKNEIRKHKWIEGEKGRKLSWEQARDEWTKLHRPEYEKFLVETLSFPQENAAGDPVAQEKQLLSETGARLSKLPHRTGG
ncbi:MAG: hypothetical protein WB586_27450 [Chthoniobacterales bacterium]